MNDKSEKILSAVDVKKFFKSPDGGLTEVLKGASLDVFKNESVSISGESGAGKTTFLNILAGLESATSGAVYWNAERIDKLSNSAQAARRARFMGFVFQNCCLVPELNAIENVEFAARIAGAYVRKNSRQRAEKLLEFVGLKHRMRHLPHQLSGGEKQRVAIARALMNSPSIILADEPTGNLDERTGESVMEMLLSLCSQGWSSLLLITHNPEFAQRTDRSVRIAQGKVWDLSGGESPNLNDDL